MNHLTHMLERVTSRADLALSPWERTGTRWTAHPDVGGHASAALRVVVSKNGDRLDVRPVRIMACIHGRVFCPQASVSLSKLRGDLLEDALFRSVCTAWFLAARWCLAGEAPDMAFGGSERGNPHGRMDGREGRAVWWLPHGTSTTAAIVDGRLVEHSRGSGRGEEVVVASNAHDAEPFSVRYRGREIARCRAARAALRAALALEGIDYEGAPEVRGERAA